MAAHTERDERIQL